MPGSTSKKVIVVRFDREPVIGYVNPRAFLQPDHAEVLSAEGSVLNLHYGDIKTIRFVKSWEDRPAEERRAFISRPKSPGLWVRFDFRDGDSLEALLPNRLLDLSPMGFDGIPPDSAGNTQRVFVPRAALNDCQVLGVVGVPKRGKKPPPSTDQLRMFE